MMSIPDMINIAVWIIIWVVIVAMAAVPIGMLWNAIQKWFIKKKIPDKIKKEVENERVKNAIKRQESARRYAELERDNGIEDAVVPIRESIGNPKRSPSVRKYINIQADNDTRAKYDSQEYRKDGKNIRSNSWQPRRSIFDE